MRLLKLNGDGRLDLVWFPKDRIPPYAILSHTWGTGDDDEVTFKDIAENTGHNKKGFQKLQFCGHQARADDLHYFWVDTCCIDKSNNTELTTAINSMFRWYKNAVRCYVYLSDVSVHTRDDQLRHLEWESAFRNSRWFTRGWTLQELLAPRIVQFYSRDHVRLGDKTSLEQIINSITGIAVEALQGHPLRNFSIDERFRWGEKRQTTEEEDKAYCLLGIFDVSISLLYGEGQTKAMKRLLGEMEQAGQNRLHKTLFMVPFSRDDCFIGREDILAQIAESSKQGIQSKHKRVAVVGLGGVGKSQIAIEYAYRVQKARPQTLVFWIHSSTTNRFEQGYREIADRLDLPGRDDPKVDILRLVYRWLSDEVNGQWLMLLDNVDDGDVFFAVNDVPANSRQDGQTSGPQPPLETFLPQSRNGMILITSRNSAAASNLIDTFGSTILVGPMNEKDSIALLKTRRPADKSPEADVRELAQALEGIPLAITQAAAYMKARPRVTVSVYLELFRESKANQASLLNSSDAKDLRRDHSIRHAVITTWQISFDQIQRTNREAADLLALMSMFDRQGVPGRLLHNNADRLKFEDAIAPLISFSLIREQSEGDVFVMHRLVQLSTRKWVERDGQMQRWKSNAIKILAMLFPSGDYETWSDCQVLLPHATEVLSDKWVDEENILDCAAINNNMGWYLLLRGESVTAEGILHKAIAGREKKLGVNHPSTLTSVSNFAAMLRSLGRYKEAESMNRRALEGREKDLGLNHPDTLTSVSNLAVVLQRLGRYKEVELMNQRALEGREKELGVKHPDTLTSVNYLAVVLRSLGRYEEAESMNRRALEGREKELGVDHPDTLTSVSNLAGVLESLGRYEEAESMNRRALKGREKELGVNHPYTLTSVSNLAGVLEKLGRYEEAELMNRRALEGRVKELGANHPSTLTSVSNLAEVLQSLGKYEEAESMNRRALEGREKELGVNHPNTLTSVNNLAWVLQILGRYKEAESMNRRALEGYEKELGINHPNTLTSVSNLAAVLQSLGRYKEAELMNRRALEGKEKELGVNHPHTLNSVYNLANLLTSAKQYEAAVGLYQRACNGYKLALGPNHPLTLSCQEHYSLLLYELQRDKANQTQAVELGGGKSVEE